jgi:hypothetical protein
MLTAVLVLVIQKGQAQDAREPDVKAVFLYNFAQFVEWPVAAFPHSSSPLVIGILGSDPFGSTLDELVKDESVRGRKIAIERYHRAEDIQLCHILFIGDSEERRLRRVLQALAGRPILTVSDLDGFAQQGGMIRFYTERSKVRLRINNDAARAVHLVISSKLLRIADVITVTPLRQ